MADTSRRAAARAQFTQLGQRANQSRHFRLVSNWLRDAWAAVLVILLALALGVAALINPGVEKTDLRLNEGAIYVQNQNRSLLGSLNYQIDAIAAATSVGDQQTSIFQEGNFVLVNNAGSSTLQTYDPATNTLSSPVTPPTGAEFSLNAGKLAVTNPDNGRVWYGDAAELARSDFQSSATLNTEDFGHGVVTADGELIGLNVQESVVVRADESKTAVPFELDSTTRSAQLSSVGDKAIVLDRTSQQLWIEGSRQPITVSGGSGAKLAAPAASAAAGGRRAQAIYATQAGLIAIVDGKPKSLTGQLNATPITPVVVGECVYGAFGRSFVKVCKGGEPDIRAIPELPPTVDLRFLVNRDNVALQDVKSGKTWLVDKGMKIVNNWDEVIPETEERRTDPNPPDDRVTLPDRTKPNRPPVAQDDPQLAARVGRSTTLPILDNDSDEDGDLLTLVAAPKVDGANLQVTGDGAGLQITLPQEANGSYRFTYEITDGRGGFASAVATVAALPADPKVSNQKPVNIRQHDTLIMNSGTTASKRVLVNWRDPDGDDLVLVNAKPENDESEDEVSFTADGTVIFRDVGKTTGIKRVRVWVSDGTVEVEGYLNVDVRKRGSAPPIANGDFVTTMVGREVLVRPLLNDEGNALTLTEVDPSTPTYTVIANYAENEFRFRSNTPGVYYLQYKVSNGPVSVGLVRIDVKPTTDQNNPPVAVRDVALVPFGGSVLVDPLLNDTDADNDVLVVQSVSQHPALRVVMRDRHLLTISSIHHSSEPIALTYWVSDGRNSTPGTIMVYPAPPAGSHAPRAYPDQVKARAGSVISVPVLRNDISPVGLALKLVRLPENPPNAWIDGDVVRIRIPENEVASTRQIVYEIEDVNLRRTSATINMTIVSQDAQNEAPLPPLVEARVLSGSETKIPISLLGLDPNGDTVRLLGLGSGPRLGRVTEVAESWIRYQAYPDARGTDTFRYQVIDSFGAIGSGEIRVGVAPRTDNNLGPTGVPDIVTVRPGRAVTLPVLANDYDVDGDSFSFAPDRAPEMPFPAEIVEDQFLGMRAPDKEGDYVGKYYLQDARGAQGNGSVYLNVRSDAALLAPVANDDQLQVNDILGKDWVQADVLANDFDIDGSREDLKLSLPDARPSEAIVQDGKISVKVKNQMQQIRYQVTDGDGNSAFAILLVPGHNDSVPVLANPGEVHEVIAGDLFTISLAAMVKGTGGRETRLTTAEAVSATKGQVTVRPDAIDFRADVRYAGPASVVFEVTDAAGPEDTTGKRAFLTVLIDVKPAPDSDGRRRDTNSEQVSNLAPSGPARIELQVGAGEPPELFNIRPQFSDPEGDNFNFDSWQIDSTDGITINVGVGNDTFTAKAGLTNKGAMATMRGRVFDVVGASREVTVVVRVVGSTRPLPEAQPDVVPDAAAGRTSTVPVLLNDRSFLLDNQDLKVVGASVVNGNGSVSFNEKEVIITPGADMVGPMTVRYTIVDGTNDPDRHVDGQVQLTVRSRPGQPKTPQISRNGIGEVEINWTSGDPNGSPITGAMVTARPGVEGYQTKTEPCDTNTCTIRGLKNGIEWFFSVVESNELGESPRSPESAAGFPDIKPNKMKPPTLERQKPNVPGTLVLSWAEADSDGSGIEKYRILQVGSDQVVAELGKDARAKVFENLTIGQSYQYVIQATNKTGEWSEPSDPSEVKVPARPPSPPLNVTASDLNETTGNRLRVKWDKPADDGGDRVETYTVVATPLEQINGAVPITEKTQDATAELIIATVDKVPYRVTVQANSSVGSSEASQPSAPSFSYGAPTETPTVKVETIYPNKVTVTVLPPQKTDDYNEAEVRIIHGNAASEPIHAEVGKPVHFDAEPKKDYTVDIKAIYQPAQGEPKPQAGFTPTNHPPVTPFGPPKVPNVRVTKARADQQWDFAFAGEKNTYVKGRYVGGEWKMGEVGADRITIPSDGLTRTYEFQRCEVDGERQNNCSESYRIVDQRPPISARISSPNQIIFTVPKDALHQVHCYSGTDLIGKSKSATVVGKPGDTTHEAVWDVDSNVPITFLTTLQCDLADISGNVHNDPDGKPYPEGLRYSVRITR